MKVILIGYPGSQCIVPASKYLTNKYIPFEVEYINYKGDINKWSSFLAGYLTAQTDENIIFALDDYLVADYLDATTVWDLHDQMIIDESVACIKLCHSTPEEHAEYPVTTQYCIWDRKYLIWLLEQVNTPWEFEIKGSAIFKQGNKKVLHRPCLDYFTNSSISSRWEGVRLDGLKDEDINYIKSNGLI